MADNNSADLPHNIMGFVGDPVSEQIIAKVITDMNIAYAEIKQGTVEDTIEFLKNNKTPRILIIDVSDSELPIGDIKRIKEYCTPNVEIIVIGIRNEVGLFRDLIGLGARDYLAKPLNHSLLCRSINVANGVVTEFVEKTGKMISVLSSVGGAGSTTVTANIAWILANKNFKRTLVMDVDFQFGVINLTLDMKVENAYLDILESPEKIDEYFIETILKKYNQRLYYLGGLVDLLRGVNVDLKTFDVFVTFVKKQFNYVLVDIPRNITGISEVCFSKSDSFIIMVEMSVASAQNTLRLLELLNTNQPGKKVIVAANKIGLSSVGALSRESFEKVINKKIDYIIPYEENTVLATANIGQPLACSGGPVTEVLENIAEYILGKTSDQEMIKALKAKNGGIIEKIKDLTLGIVNKI